MNPEVAPVQYWIKEIKRRRWWGLCTTEYRVCCEYSTLGPFSTREVAEYYLALLDAD